MNTLNDSVVLEISQDAEPAPSHAILHKTIEASANWLIEHLSLANINSSNALPAALSTLRPCLHYNRLQAFLNAQGGALPTTIQLSIVDPNTSHSLNLEYRQQDKPTNILSFHGLYRPEIHLTLLGDLVVNAQLTAQEAEQQNKSLDAHWTHLLIHGFLHLLGFDHENDDDAHVMESLEIILLSNLGFDNPYTLQATSSKTNEVITNHKQLTGSQLEAKP